MLKSNNQNKLTIFLMSCMIQNIFFVYKKGTLMVIKVTYCEKVIPMYIVQVYPIHIDIKVH